MPSLNAGSSYNQYIGAGMSVRIQTNHNQFGRIYFIATNDEEAPPSGLARSFGPLPVDQTFGPWGIGGTVYIENDAGSSGALTYTVNNETAAPGNFTSVAVSSSYTQAAGTFSSSGTGAKTLTANSTGSVTLGATGTGSTTITRVNSLTVVSTDSSGTPGNATNNNLSGRAAFAAAASTVVITNSLVTAASKVFVSLGGSDATLTSVRVTPAAGSFTVTGNAAATATTVFDFLVVN